MKRFAWIQKRRVWVWQIGILALCLFIPVYCVTEIMELDGSDDEDGEVEALQSYEHALTHKMKRKEQCPPPSSNSSNSLSDSSPASISSVSRWMTAARLRLDRGQQAALHSHSRFRPQTYLPVALSRTTSPTTDPA
jgi:hypothetical protein